MHTIVLIGQRKPTQLFPQSFFFDFIETSETTASKYAKQASLNDLMTRSTGIAK